MFGDFNLIHTTLKKKKIKNTALFSGKTPIAFTEVPPFSYALEGGMFSS